jgi:hypothetical protein
VRAASIAVLGDCASSFTETDCSDQHRATPLQVTSEYLFSRYPLNLLTILFKSPLQIGKQPKPLFKCDTSDGAPDSALPVMSIKSDRAETQPNDSFHSLGQQTNMKGRPSTRAAFVQRLAILRGVRRVGTGGLD